MSVRGLPAIETWNLGKRYPRPRWLWETFRRAEQIWVLKGVSLTVQQGEFFGIVGPNGTGKTTFLKLVAALLEPDAGGAVINGHDLRTERSMVRRSVAIAPAQASNGVGILWQLNCRKNLIFRARLCGVGRTEAARRADHVLERLEMGEKAEEFTWSLSAGELQKLSLAMTFVSRTPLVILDEPTSHLDPKVARLIRRFAREELNEANGQTVILSTHYLEEAAELCSRVAVLWDGRVLDCDTPAALKRRHVSGPIVQIRAVNYSPEVGSRIKQRCGVFDMAEDFENIDTGAVKLGPVWSGGEADPEVVRRELEREGVEVLSIQRVEPTLQHVYLALMQKAASHG